MGQRAHLYSQMGEPGYEASVQGYRHSMYMYM